MADKVQPQGFSKAKIAKPDDDDVEGHRFTASRATEPDGHSRSRAIEPDGHAARKATEDDDVEGHSMLINPLVARELAHARERDVQANVKRHNFENDARAAKKERG